MRFVKKFLSKIQLLNNRRKSFIRVSFEKGFPRLIVQEKYESIVKWILRIITLIGICSSLFALPPLWNLVLAVILLIVEQFFERAVFEYTTFFVQPLPDFTYDAEEWKAMYFGVPTQPELPFLIGIAFETKNYAAKFFNLLRKWNYNSDTDISNNICLSFIIEDDSNYSTYIYPNEERSIIKKTKQKIEEDYKLKKYGKLHQQLIVEVIFCKTFPYGSKSSLNMFLKNYKNGEEYMLKAGLYRNGQIEPLDDIPSIKKWHLKVKQRKELSQADTEYAHGRYVMCK
jgi:hypothetical protein